MSEANTVIGTNALHEPVNDEIRELIETFRCGDAPEEALSQAMEHIKKANEVLKPHRLVGEGWSTISVAGESPGLDWSEDDITMVMPYSPISGKRNPLAPPLMLRKEDGDIHGEAIFSPTYAGPPNSVHGGIIAAVFDEILAMANVISGNAGFTGTLTIRYHKTTPLNTPIELWGTNVRQDGRKQISRGEMRVDGVVTASAEGLFICADGLGGDPTKK
ncbi:MAG: acyl-coenzyme A thioesterase PaaI-like protein [Halioglobus sp.]|jgi:acyl-coenzyme A thioesterase PaaI-like protein